MDHGNCSYPFEKVEAFLREKALFVSLFLEVFPRVYLEYVGLDGIGKEMRLIRRWDW